MLSALQGKLGLRADSKGIENKLREAAAKATERNFDAYLLRKSRRNEDRRNALAAPVDVRRQSGEREEELTDEEVIRREVRAELDAEEEASKEEMRQEIRARIMLEERQRRAGGVAG